MSTRFMSTTEVEGDKVADGVGAFAAGVKVAGTQLYSAPPPLLPVAVSVAAASTDAASAAPAAPAAVLGLVSTPPPPPPPKRRRTPPPVPLKVERTAEEEFFDTLMERVPLEMRLPRSRAEEARSVMQRVNTTPGVSISISIH